MSSAVRTRSLALLATIALSACGGSLPERVPLIDLVAVLETARVEPETTRVAFAEPEGRRHLIEGWSFTRIGHEPESFVWTEGERASLWFQVGEARDLTLELVCRAFPYPDAPTQTVELGLGGQLLGSFDVQPIPTTAVIEVPADRLSLGANRLELRPAWQVRPAEVVPSERDRVLRSIACESLAIRDAEDGGRPEAKAGPRLGLPGRTEVAWFVRPPDGSALQVGAVHGAGGSDGAGQGALQVAFRVAGEGPGEPRTFAAGAGPILLELPPSVDRPLEIVFRNPTTFDVDVEAPVVVGAGSSAAPAAAEVAVERDPRPNVLVYLVDTLRRDRLGLYGYGRGTSPHIDAFGAGATVFDRAVAQSPWTRPSVASLFTALDPPHHGVQRPSEALPAELPSLPSLLRDAGYQTLGIVTNGNVSETFGFDRGFEKFRYLDRVRPPDLYELSHAVNRVALRWLENRDPDRPFFLYLHSSDPHAPYTPHEPYRERFAPEVDDPFVGTLLHTNKLKHEGGGLDDVRNLSDLYDGEVAYNDEHFGRLLDRLQTLGLLESTLIVFVSDHGEAFKEHGTWQHGTTLYQEEISIPLVIRFPGGWGAGTRVSTMARQIDVLPTVLDWLGVEIPDGLDGHSLLPAVASPSREPVFARSYLARRRGDWTGVTHEGHKLVRARAHEGGGMREWMFDLSRDPGEQDDVRFERPVWHGFLSNRVDEAEAAGRDGGVAPTPEIDPELRKHLEMLGYL